MPLGVIGVDLRVAPQRHRGHRRALPEIGQRRHPARRVKEAARTNAALADAVAGRLHEGRASPPEPCSSSSRRTARWSRRLLTASEYIDMIIPRGGAGLHQFCAENATIPVITGGIGICHIYVDESADLDKAVADHL